MNQEQFKLIRTDLNRVFETINKTKILGRDEFYSKFEEYDRRIKNIIEIPKLKTIDDTISYTCQQLLYANTIRLESTNSTEFYLDLKLEINCREDFYNAIFVVTSNYKSYSPSFKINPYSNTNLNEDILSENLIDFLEKLRNVYNNLTELKYDDRVYLVDSAKAEDINVLVKTIIEKLRGD